MKTIDSALLAHLQSGTTTLAMAWKVERRDGEVFGFTDHDRPIVFDGVTYGSASVFDSSAVSVSGELNVDNVDVEGLIDGDGIDAESVENGVWDGAVVTLYRVNWNAPEDGAEILLTGEVGNVQRKDGRYVAEIRGLMFKLQNALGRVLVPTCNASFGDARCGVDIEALRVSGTVTSVTSRRTFADSSLPATAPGAEFSLGDLTFTTGANAGATREVRQQLDDGALVVFLPFNYDVEVGDEFTIVPGCDKAKTTCIASYDNVLNFRGFSFVPGLDQTLLIGGQ